MFVVLLQLDLEIETITKQLSEASESAAPDPKLHRTTRETDNGNKNMKSYGDTVEPKRLKTELTFSFLLSKTLHSVKETQNTDLFLTTYIPCDTTSTRTVKNYKRA